MFVQMVIYLKLQIIRMIAISYLGIHKFLIVRDKAVLVKIFRTENLSNEIYSILVIVSDELMVSCEKRLRNKSFRRKL